MESYRNVYVYKSSTLWIPYSAAIAVAGGLALIGLFLMWWSEAAYDGRFSTVLRVSRIAELDEDIVPGDDGRGPLPMRLAGATMTMQAVSTGFEKLEGGPGSEEVLYTQVRAKKGVSWVGIGGVGSQRGVVSAGDVVIPDFVKILTMAVLLDDTDSVS